MRAILSEFLLLSLSCVLALGAAHRTIAQNAAPAQASVPAFGWVEETVTVTAKPRIEPPGNLLGLRDTKMTNASRQIGCGIPPHIRSVPVPLDTNQAYTFTVFQKKLVMGGRNPSLGVTLTELRKVELGGRTIYDLEVCEAHKTRMAHTEVPIRYGLIPETPEPRDAARRPTLPHHREYALGGCMVGPGNPATKKVFVCSECKKGFEKWTQEEAKARDEAFETYRKQMFDENGVPHLSKPWEPRR